MTKRWTAKCWMGSKSGYVDIQVNASTVNGAKEQLVNIYGAEQVVNLREISSDGSSNSSEVSIEGLLLLGGLALFLFYADWVLMLGAGAGSTWVAEKVSGFDLSKYLDKPKEEQTPSNDKKALIIGCIAIIFGGIGFITGHNFKNYQNDESSFIFPRNEYSQKMTEKRIASQLSQLNPIITNS